MVLQFLALLPTIFDAVSSVSSLFDDGKKAFEVVTGSRSKAMTAQDLRNEVDAMPPDQAEAWVAQMEARVRLYAEETERLRIQGGGVTPEVLELLGPATAAKVAIMRMTTRPWAIRWMVRALVAPPLFIIFVDGLTMLAQNIASAAGGPFQMKLMIERLQTETGQGYFELYGMLVEPATATIIAYMTLRGVDKARQAKGQPSIASGIGATVGRLIKMFRK